MSDISLADFNLSSEILGIFETEKIQEIQDVLYNLELYKFRTRMELVSILNEKVEFESNSGFFGNGTKNGVYDIYSVIRDEKFLQLETEQNIIVSIVSENTVDVIVPIFQEIDQTAISLRVLVDNIQLKYVTPYNFQMLFDSDFKPCYKPDILFKRLILECINRHATDLHITVKHFQKKPFYPVECRVGSNMSPIDLFTFDESLNKSVIMSIIERKSNKDSVDLTTSSGITAAIPDVFNDKTTELRVSANKVVDGFECVCRIQRTDTVTLTIDTLGFPQYTQDALFYLARKRSGITFITGAIRTGKNTTAFALANEMVKHSIKLKSFESPIEALMPFPQVDYLDVPENLANSVRLAKKQDVNVGLLNEIPNKEVAFAVKDLVNSSIYVITTLHLDRLWHLPYRLYEYYGDSYKDLISQINGVVNQKMFGVQCPHCLSNIMTADLEDTKKREFLLEHNITTVAVNKGCSYCTDIDTGISGLLPGINQPYVEFLVFDMDLKRELLQCNKPYEMEEVLHSALVKTGHTLENEICEGIKNNKVPLDALDFII